MPTGASCAPAPARRSRAERDELVVMNRRLVYKVVAKFFSHVPHLRDDLVSEGMLALVHVAERWRPEIAAFSTFAVVSLIRFLRRAVRRNDTITIPEYISGPEREDLAQKLKPLSLVEALTGRQTEDDPTDDADHARRVIGEAMRYLPTRWRRAIEMRYLEGRSLQEAGDELGVSKERVRQLVARAIARLRQVLEGMTGGGAGRISRHNP